MGGTFLQGLGQGLLGGLSGAGQMGGGGAGGGHMPMAGLFGAGGMPGGMRPPQAGGKDGAPPHQQMGQNRAPTPPGPPSRPPGLGIPANPPMPPSRPPSPATPTPPPRPPGLGGVGPPSPPPRPPVGEASPLAPAPTGAQLKPQKEAALTSDVPASAPDTMPQPGPRGGKSALMERAKPAPSYEGAPGSASMSGVPAEGAKLLNALSGPESGGGYNVLFGGSKFSDYSKHPWEGKHAPGGHSDSGKYQFTLSTWHEAQRALGLKDFSPQSQDKAAWWLAQRDYQRNTGRPLDADLKSGKFTPKGLQNTWVSIRNLGADKWAGKYYKGATTALGGGGAPGVGASGGTADSTGAFKMPDSKLGDLSSAKGPDVSSIGQQETQQQKDKKKQAGSGEGGGGFKATNYVEIPKPVDPMQNVLAQKYASFQEAVASKKASFKDLYDSA